MKIQDSVVLITGANRGIGLAFAREAIARGARHVYAGTRNTSTITLPGIEAIKLDVTNPDDIAAAAVHASDTTILINNAGIALPSGLLAADAEFSIRTHLETNFFGPLKMSSAFAPLLASNGGGAILNVLSVVSWICTPLLAAYSTSKSAAWSMTNGLRHELRSQGTQVLGLHMGFVDTDLTREIDAPKSPPELIVSAAFDALESGAEEVLADEITRKIHRGLSEQPSIYLGL